MTKKTIKKEKEENEFELVDKTTLRNKSTLLEIYVDYHIPNVKEKDVSKIKRFIESSTSESAQVDFVNHDRSGDLYLSVRYDHEISEDTVEFVHEQVRELGVSINADWATINNIDISGKSNKCLI